MQRQLETSCDQHPSRFDCPDALVHHDPVFEEYGLIVHDGGSGTTAISFCPWCGAALPSSLRDRWFDELRALGFDDPTSQPIPDRYRTSEWHRS